MDPRDASVYTNTWSPVTWVLILTVVIVCVTTLLVAFIALVHRSIEHSADTPRRTTADGLSAVPGRGTTTGTAAVSVPDSTHAA